MAGGLDDRVRPKEPSARGKQRWQRATSDSARFRFQHLGEAQDRAYLMADHACNRTFGRDGSLGRGAEPAELRE